MFVIRSLALILQLTTGIVSAWAQHGAVEHLRCDGVDRPLAVEASQPRFSWQFGGVPPRGTREIAARVIVASTELEVRSGRGGLWDSGWVNTSELSMTYAGPSLKPDASAWWSVSTRTVDSTAASEAQERHSGASMFHTAPSDWTGKWIQAPWSTVRDGAELDGSRPMPLFRRQFPARTRPVEALLRVAGLGQYEVTMNGHAVSAPGLHQAWTAYRKTVTYDTYDVTARVLKGNNAIGVIVGNGMNNVQMSGTAEKHRYTKFEGTFGPPKMIAELRLRYADGTTEMVGSDERWKVHAGPVVFSSTYGGEDFDGRRLASGWDRPKFRDGDWSAAAVVEGPGGRLRSAMAPDVLEVKEFQPIHRTIVAGSKEVFDLGQNFAGWPRVRVHGPAGAILRLTPGELLKADGSVSQGSSGEPQWWSYTLRGKGDETWTPRFSYYGFRYVQAEWVSATDTGLPSTTPPAAPTLKGRLVDLRGEELSSNSPVVGAFESSDESLNAIHRIIVAAMHNNEVSLFTDCPHREKLGWLEETHLIAPGLMFNNDLQGLMRATDRNMADSQMDDGMVPTIAPQYTKFGPQYAVFDDSPEWGSASVLAPWATYRFYGDTGELERAYPAMQAYVRFLESKAQDGIVAYGLGDWYDIGPGGPGVGKQTTLGVTGTLMLFEDAMVMQKIATKLGRVDEAAIYATLAERERSAYNAHFWNADSGYYDKGSQTANAMPLALGVVPEERRAAVLAHVVDDIRAHNNHVTTGEIGYPYMVRALMEAGRGDVLLSLMLQPDPPSYRSQLVAGATALTEAWDANPSSSQDHFMLGGASEWFYRGLGGIDFDMSRPERVVIYPEILDGLGWVRASYDSQLGKIEASWKRDGAGTTMDVIVPGGVTAVVHIATTTGSGVWEGETGAERSPGVELLGSTPLESTYRIGSGSYHFRTGGPKGVQGQ